MAVPVTTNPGFEAGTPVALFQDTALTNRFGPYPAYDAALDGKHFLTINTQRDIAQPALRVVQNWFAEVQAATAN